MTSFINIKYPTQHMGAKRIESAIDATRRMRQGFSGMRVLATLLLALVTVVMVVADQVMDSIAEGHLLMVWVGLWAVAFAALAFFAGAARQMAVRARASLDSWSSSLAEARADQRLWAIARQDARVMADLQAAQSRSEVLAAPALAASAAPVSAAPKAERAPRSRSYSILRAYERHYL
jgi:hypothetical protein